MKPNWHYYEAHVTIREPADHQTLLNALTFMGLKVVDLVNIDLDGMQNEEGVITTMHSSNLQTLTEETSRAVKTLQSLNYEVLRYKIESTVIDSKYEDKLGCFTQTIKS